MTDRLLEELDRRATARSLIFLAAAFLLFTILILPVAAGRIESYSGGVGILDLELSFSPDEAYSRVQAYGPEGRRLYAWVEVTADVAFPVITTLLFSLFILFCLRRARPETSGFRRLALIPFGGLFADLLENVGIVTLLLIHPSRSNLLARLTSFATSVKWLFVAGTVAIALLASGAALFRRLLPDTGGDGG